MSELMEKDVQTVESTATADNQEKKPSGWKAMPRKRRRRIIRLIIFLLVIAAAILVLYLLSWIFSKKPRVGWMIFSLVFFALDTLFMLWFMGISADMILDVVFHAWVLISLTNGIVSYFKLKKLPEEEPAEPLQEETAPVETEE